MATEAFGAARGRLALEHRQRELAQARVALEEAYRQYVAARRNLVRLEMNEGGPGA